MDNKSLNTLFHTDPLSEEQLEALTDIRMGTRALAELFNRLLPETQEKQLALQNLYGALSSARQAIEMYGPSHTVSPIVMANRQ
jgi:hypothetical protein